MENTELKFKIQELLHLWQDFCKIHTELYNVTCDEYLHLIESDIEQIEADLEKKNEIITQINTLNDKRVETNNEVSKLLGKENTTKLKQLLEQLTEAGENAAVETITKSNALLLDMVDKIQEQNKKNQFYLNKAIHSLKEIREQFKGEKNYSTYSSKGKAAAQSVY